MIRRAMTTPTPNPPREWRPEEILGPLNDIESKYAPKYLYTQGDVNILRSRSRVAIVGSRKATDLGLKRAERLAGILVKQDVIIVSGLAEGIDTAAQKATIGAHGTTIAVVGTPLDKSYPKENTDLQAEIGLHHLLISQFPVGYPIKPQNFVIRNRTMALIADASVIVEASDGGGSLSQGWEALRLGRPLFLMKSILDNKNLTWPAKMLDYGAQVLREPDDLLQELVIRNSRTFENVPF